LKKSGNGLEPFDCCIEVMLGVILALRFPSTLSVYYEGAAEIQRLRWAVNDANVAWGIIDGFTLPLNFLSTLPVALPFLLYVRCHSCKNSIRHHFSGHFV